MRIILTSFGSMGDVQPLVALAVRLQERGHKPILALSPNFAARAKQNDIEFIPIGPNMAKDDIRDVIEKQSVIKDPIEQVRHYLQKIMPGVPAMYKELLGVCGQGDVLVSTPYQLAGRMVYDRLRIPYVTLHFSHFASKGNKALREASSPIINECRNREGLPSLADPYGLDAASPMLALYAVSEQVIRRPKHWPAHNHVVGYFFLDDVGWNPQPDLVEFLRDGEAPVAVSFGSVTHRAPREVTGVLCEALSAAGCRGGIQRGWSGLGGGGMGDNVLAVDYVPHHWLFTRASCVVHHGGAGTTAAALRAGVPTVIVPHTLDQPIWAQLSKALGNTGAVIPFSRLSADTLEQAIVNTLRQPRHKRLSQAIAKKISDEDGVGKAIDLIEANIIDKM